ncbi:helix-turn-helix domain-containing protein [Acidovorax sp. M14]|uniref:helix-turn-helix domain-containing protein n=1 Tax=Acidovorax sp. M14 TaxID=3411354 RepID=UPI003BF590DE
MGRKSKLTERQWEQIGKRLLAGESGRALAKEFGVSEATIRGRFSAQVAEIKTVANQIVATEQALKALPISAQIAAHNLADELIAISTHLAGAGKFGAATAHRLSGIAHAKVQEIDDAAPLDEESMDALKGVAVLTRMANESSQIGMNLLQANKDSIKEMNQKMKPPPKRVVVEVVDASAPDA